MVDICAGYMKVVYKPTTTKTSHAVASKMLFTVGIAELNSPEFGMKDPAALVCFARDVKTPRYRAKPLLSLS